MYVYEKCGWNSMLTLHKISASRIGLRKRCGNNRQLILLFTLILYTKAATRHLAKRWLVVTLFGCHCTMSQFDTSLPFSQA